MTAEQWQRAKALVAEALERPPADRAAFLDERCGDDLALRDELRALLAAGADAPSILDAPLGELALLVDDESGAARPDPHLGRTLGPYRVLRQIGRGGMGTVYLGLREQPFKQYVALKLVRGGVDAGHLLQRFEMERQILASLSHPGIARLVDGGTADDGVPYLVMEYVEGVPITEYCDRRTLPVEERLRLFRDVCRAVHYAHQNLVVHRDLKPSNILVAVADGAAQVKLLDFGVAKLLNPALSPIDVPVTQTLARLMTPEYAAPEQVRGEPVTTATDVYALGVLLYELLTGRRPYRLGGRSLGEIERAICESDPERPSTRAARDETIVSHDGREQTITAASVSAARATEPGRLRRRLSGDLDNIVLKAMRKEPRLRYGSAERLASEVEHYLRGLPVEARPSTVTYRTRKFVQRHRLGVATGLGVLALLAGFGLRERRLRADAELARDAARLEAEKSQRVTSFLMALFEANDPDATRGEEVSARTLMERGVARVEELRAEPAVQAQMLDVVGQVYLSLGDFDRAEPLLRRALASRRRELGDTHPDVATSLHSVGTLLTQTGEYAEAERSLRSALALKRTALGPEHPDVPAVLNDLASLLTRAGRYDEAERIQREVLAMQRRLLGDESLDVARSLNTLAFILRRKGDYKGAERLYRESLALKRKLVGEEHSEVALGLNNVAFMLMQMGDYAGAEPLYREALALNRKLYGAEHPQVASNMNNLASLFYKRGDLDSAEALFREALAMRRRLFGEVHPDVSEGLNNLAVVRRARGDYRAAESLFQQVLAIDRRRLGAEHPFVATTLSNLGHVLHKQGEHDRSERVLREALAMRRKLLGPEHLDVAVTMSTLAALLVDRGNYNEAERLYDGALASFRRQFDETHERVQGAYRGLASLYSASGRPERAAEYRAKLVADTAGSAARADKRRAASSPQR